MAAYQRKFILKALFSNISGMGEKERKHSQTETHFGLPWHLSLMKGEGTIGCYLHNTFNNNNRDFELNVTCSMSIVDKRSQPITSTKSITWTQQTSKEGYGIWDISRENDLERIINNKLLIQCIVTIKSLTGVGKKRQRNFLYWDKEMTDFVIKAGQKHFFVSKAVVTSQSTVIKKLYEEQVKPRQDTPMIDLGNIDVTAFEELLEEMYFHNALNDNNIRQITKLSVNLSVDCVVAKCEDYLINRAGNIPKREKLRVAIKYKMDNLKFHLLNNATNLDEYRLTLPHDLSCLDLNTCRTVIQKMLEIGK